MRGTHHCTLRANTARRGRHSPLWNSYSKTPVFLTGTKKETLRSISQFVSTRKVWHDVPIETAHPFTHSLTLSLPLSLSLTHSLPPSLPLSLTHTSNRGCVTPGRCRARFSPRDKGHHWGFTHWSVHTLTLPLNASILHPVLDYMLTCPTHPSNKTIACDLLYDLCVL